MITITSALGFPARAGILGRQTAFGDILDGDFLAAADLAQVVLDMVDGDAVEPGAEFGFELEFGQMAVHLDEHVLGQIIGRGRVLNESIRQVIHFRLIPLDKGFEGPAVPPPGALDQRLVVHSVA